MKNPYASVFLTPRFKASLARYELMRTEGPSAYFDTEELLDIAEYYASEEKVVEAEEVLDYALQLHPGHTEILVYKARARLLNGDLHEAQRIADSIAEQDDSEAIYLRAELLLSNNEEVAAEKLLRELLKADGQTADGYADIVELYMDSQRYEKAMAWIDEGLAHYPKEVCLMEAAAECYASCDRRDEAIDYLNRLLDMDAYSATYWEQLGKLYFEEERYEEAIEALEYELAIEDGESTDHARMALANAYINIGQYEKAEHEYQILQQRHPESPAIAFYQGLCLMRMKDDDRAWELFVEALRLTDEEDTEKGHIYQQMGLICSNKGNHGEALKYIDKAVEQLPDNHELLILRGHEYLYCGDMQTALKNYLKALDNCPESTEEYLYLIAVSLLENKYFTISRYIFDQLMNRETADKRELYPYLCLCQWVLNDEEFEETLEQSLTLNAEGTYGIFMLEPRENESTKAFVKRLRNQTETDHSFT